MSNLDLTHETLSFLICEKPVTDKAGSPLIRPGDVVALKHSGWCSGGRDDAIGALVFYHAERGIMSTDQQSEIIRLLKICRQRSLQEAVPHPLCTTFGVLPDGTRIKAGTVMRTTTSLALKKGITIPEGTNVKCVERGKDHLGIILRMTNGRVFRCQLDLSACHNLAYVGDAAAMRDKESGAMFTLRTEGRKGDRGLFIVCGPRARSIRFEPGEYAGSLEFASRKDRYTVEGYLAFMLEALHPHLSMAEEASLEEYPASVEDYLEYLNTTQGVESFAQYMHHLYRQLGVRAA